MKKQLLLVLLAILPMMVNAEEVEIDGLWYNLVSKVKTAEVIQYKNDEKYSGDVIIPSTIYHEEVEYEVKSIGVNAFYFCEDLTSISIPNSITNIGNQSFWGCSKLTSVIIPNGVSSINSFAFSNCKSLTSITIPNSVTTIGDNAFYGCSSLCLISIPNSVSFIGDCAFQGCSSLKSIHITDMVTWCNIKYSSNSGPCFSDYNLYLNGEQIKDLVLPNSIMAIHDHAFEGCSGLTTITIPSNVKSIGISAFRNCTGITSVIIPNSITSIDNFAFYGCSNLSHIILPNSLSSIGSWSFYGCSALTSLTIGNSVKTINYYAFANCQELAEVFCYAESIPDASSDVFYGSYIDYATLHVPEVAYEDYRTTEPWSNFGTIKVIDGETPIVEKCATPTITYANGKVRFACETEGVEYVPTVTCSPNQLQNGNELSIGGTFTVSVYAVKDGYDNSDTATMTINMSQMGDVNADGELNAADVTAVVNAILGK